MDFRSYKGRILIHVEFVHSDRLSKRGRHVNFWMSKLSLEWHQQNIDTHSRWETWNTHWHSQNSFTQIPRWKSTLSIQLSSENWNSNSSSNSITINWYATYFEFNSDCFHQCSRSLTQDQQMSNNELKFINYTRRWRREERSTSDFSRFLRDSFPIIEISPINTIKNLLECLVH